MKGILSRCAMLAAAAGMTAGCQTLSQYPQQPVMTAAGNVEVSRVRFSAVRDLGDLQAKCLNRDPGFVVYACAYPQMKWNEPRRSVCTVFAMLPRDASEATQVAILGHEVWHCFGAIHADARMVASR